MAEHEEKWEAYDQWGHHTPVPCWTEDGAKATADHLSSGVNRWRAREVPRGD